MILAVLLFVALVPSICPAQDPWNQSQQFMSTKTVGFQQQSSMAQPTQSQQLMSISADGSQQQSSMPQPTQSQQLMSISADGSQQQSSMPQPTQSQQLMSISVDGSQQQSSMPQPTQLMSISADGSQQQSSMPQPTQSQQLMSISADGSQQQSSMPQPTQSQQLMSISADGSQQQSSMPQPTPQPQTETPATNPPSTQPQTDVPFVNSSGNGGMCPSQIDEIWGIVWPETESGTVAILPCPQGFKGFAARFCGIIDWLIPDFYNCVGKDLDGVSSQANTFFEGGGADVEGAIFLIELLSNLTMPPKQMSNSPFLTQEDLTAVNYIAGQTINLLMRRRGGDRDRATEILDLFNNALDSRNRESWTSLQQSQSGSEELLSIAESYAFYLAGTLNSSSNTARFSRENLALRANHYSNDGGFSDSRFPTASDIVNSSTTDTTSSINIPSAYLEARANFEGGDVTVVHMLFTTIQDFLPDNSTTENTTLASIIISSQIVSSYDDSEFESVLKDNPIELTFALNVSYNASFENITIYCVYWMFSTDFNSTSTGGWVSDGIIAEFIDDTTVRCLSSHLTSFSVLVEVTGTFSEANDANTNDIEAQALSVVSYVGCSISIVCLLLTIAFLLSLRKSLFTEVYNFIHLNLAVALLLALIVFVSGIELASDISVLCKVVAALLHYLFLSAFCWMLCEAIMLFLLLIIVFSTFTKMWWLYLIIGWGLPLIPVVITLSVKINHYTHENGICWLNYENYLIWGFVGPMLLIICVNAVILIIIMGKLFRLRKQRNQRESVKKTKADLKGNASISQIKDEVTEAKDTAIHLIKGAIVLLPLLGITWIVGIFAINSNTTVFAWIFTVLNSLQGAFIFIFHVLRNKKFTGKVTKWYTNRKGNASAYTMSTKTSKSTVISSAGDQIEVTDMRM